MSRRQARWAHRLSASRHHADKLDAIAVLKRARRPFVAQQRLVVKLDEQPARIKPATGRKFAQRQGRADLPRMPIDENAKALLDGFRHAIN